MKLHLILENKTRVAHVGASIDPNNPEREIWGENDQWHIDTVMRWLIDRDEHECLYYDRRVDDFVDLNDGRDFLEENKRYDIVILHMVYSPDDPIHNSYRFHPQSQSPFRTSRLHTREAWRRRLASTGAKYIFTFGDYDEVSGFYLGAIPGYEGPIEASDMFHVYLKQ